MQAKPLILITNDDGITASGLRALIEVVRPLGRIVIVAPDKPQSGTSHSVTMHHPLRLKKIRSESGYVEYSSNGTPADCIKLAYKIILKRKPDLLISGINHGSNSSINIIYSGTMAAVFEGAMAGVPSIGFSLLEFGTDADFSAAKLYAGRIIREVMSKKLPEGICLNVNIPYVPASDIKGIRICRQAGGTWLEDFDIRKDPKGEAYYWLKGVFARIGDGEDTDEYALEHKYVSIVPVNFDFTDYPAINELKQWNFSS
ncbi:MAG: 5'/3'-nucleotidase SurE [Bacteroidales bacterium]|nr:5'/3'-nucleotidase SurE [Bacteroidales bacterium]